MINGASAAQQRNGAWRQQRQQQAHGISGMAKIWRKSA